MVRDTDITLAQTGSGVNLRAHSSQLARSRRRKGAPCRLPGGLPRWPGWPRRCPAAAARPAKAPMPIQQPIAAAGRAARPARSRPPPPRWPRSRPTADHGPDQGLRGGSTPSPATSAGPDLDHVHRQLAQLGQRGGVRARGVDGQPDAALAQLTQAPRSGLVAAPASTCSATSRISACGGQPAGGQRLQHRLGEPRRADLRAASSAARHWPASRSPPARPPGRRTRAASSRPASTITPDGDSATSRNSRCAAPVRPVAAPARQRGRPD